MPGPTVTEYPVTGFGGHSAYDGTNIWFAAQNAAIITLIGLNAITGAPFATYSITTPGSRSGPSPMIFLAGSLWISVAGVFTGTVPNVVTYAYVIEVNPATGHIISTINHALPGNVNFTPASTEAIATDGTNIYTSWEYIPQSTGLDNVVGILFNQLGSALWTQIWTPQATQPAATYDGTAFWVADAGVFTVRQLSALDGSTLQTVTLPSSGFPGYVDYNPTTNSIWTVDQNNNALININLSGTILSTTHLGGVDGNFPYSVNHDPNNRIWVIDQDNDTNVLHVEIFSATTTPVLQFDVVTDWTNGGFGMTYTSGGQLMWTQAANAANPGSPTSIEVSFGFPGTITIQCGNPPVGTVGQPYLFQFQVSGGIPPYTFSLLSGSLPPGLILNASTGVVSGIPTTPGKLFTYTIKVVDNVGNSTTTGICSGQPLPPYVQPLPYPPGTVNPPPPLVFPPGPQPPAPLDFAIAVSLCPPIDLPTFFSGGTTPQVPDYVFVDCYSTPFVMDSSYVDNEAYPHFTAFHRERWPQDERHLWNVLRRAWDQADDLL